MANDTGPVGGGSNPRGGRRLKEAENRSIAGKVKNKFDSIVLAYKSTGGQDEINKLIQTNLSQKSIGALPSGQTVSLTH